MQLEQIFGKSVVFPDCSYLKVLLNKFIQKFYLRLTDLYAVKQKP